MHLPPNKKQNQAQNGSIQLMIYVSISPKIPHRIEKTLFSPFTRSQAQSTYFREGPADAFGLAGWWIALTTSCRIRVGSRGFQILGLCRMSCLEQFHICCCFFFFWFTFFKHPIYFSCLVLAPNWVMWSVCSGFLVGEFSDCGRSFLSRASEEIWVVWTPPTTVLLCACVCTCVVDVSVCLMSVCQCVYTEHILHE